jgi:hypothetical protein
LAIDVVEQPDVRVAIPTSAAGSAQRTSPIGLPRHQSASRDVIRQRAIELQCLFVKGDSANPAIQCETDADRARSTRSSSISVPTVLPVEGNRENALIFSLNSGLD